MKGYGDPETVKIVHHKQDSKCDEYHLYIDGCSRAVLTKTTTSIGSKLTMELLFTGDFPFTEAKVFVDGLVQLAMVGVRIDSENSADELLGKLSIEEIEMAKKKVVEAEKKTARKEAKTTASKADVKRAAKTATAKTEKTDKAPRESASSMFNELILAGKLSDDAIFAAVQKKYGLSDDKRRYVSWYRWKLKKSGVKVPEPVAA